MQIEGNFILDQSRPGLRTTANSAEDQQDNARNPAWLVKKENRRWRSEKEKLLNEE